MTRRVGECVLRKSSGRLRIHNMDPEILTASLTPSERRRATRPRTQTRLRSETNRKQDRLSWLDGRVKLRRRWKSYSASRRLFARVRFGKGTPAYVRMGSASSASSMPAASRSHRCNLGTKVRRRYTPKTDADCTVPCKRLRQFHPSPRDSLVSCPCDFSRSDS